MTTVDVLREMSCLEGIPDTQMELICQIAEERDYPINTVVRREGDEADALYIVCSGRVSIDLAIPGSHVVSIYKVEVGDLFGWSSLAPPFKATADCVCEKDSRLLVLPREKLLRVFEDHVEVKAAIMETLVKRIGQRLRETRKQMTYLLINEM